MAEARSSKNKMTAMERRRRRSGASGYILIAVIVSLITAVVMIQIHDVKTRLKVYEEQDQALDEQIAAELERSMSRPRHMPKSRLTRSSGLSTRVRSSSGWRGIKYRWNPEQRRSVKNIWMNF